MEPLIVLVRPGRLNHADEWKMVKSIDKCEMRTVVSAYDHHAIHDIHDGFVLVIGMSRSMISCRRNQKGFGIRHQPSPRFNRKIPSNSMIIHFQH